MSSRSSHYTQRFLDELRTIDDEYEVMSKLNNAPGILFGMDKLINRDKIESLLQDRVNDAINPDNDDDYMITDHYSNQERHREPEREPEPERSSSSHNVSFDRPMDKPQSSSTDYQRPITRTKEDYERLRIRKDKKQKRMLQEKYTMLAYLDRMREKGVVVKPCDINSGYSEIKYETTRIRHQRRIHFGRHVFVSGLLDVIRIIEFISTKIEIINLHLDGWSQNVQYNLEEFDDVIEEIVEKWTSTDDEGGSMGPEAKLGILLLLSAVEHSTAQAGMSGSLGHIRSLFGSQKKIERNDDDIDPDILKDIEKEILKEKEKRR